MVDISTRHLRYFRALARHGHFGRAAEAVAISQPALSLQVKELEDILGGLLVERNAKHVQLTSLGEAVAARADAILRAIDELADVARAQQGPLRGRFRIGVIPTIAPYLLPRVIKGLTRYSPALDIVPREAVTGRLVADLLAMRLDAAIVALPVSEPALQETPLFDEEFVMVRPARALQGGAAPAMKLLLLEEGHCFRDQAMAYCKSFPAAAGHRTLSQEMPAMLRDVVEGSNLSTLVQMVAAGLGVTLVPQMAVPVETRTAKVSVRRLPSPRPTRTIGMLWRKSSPLAAQLESVAAIIRKSCGGAED